MSARAEQAMAERVAVIEADRRFVEDCERRVQANVNRILLRREHAQLREQLSRFNAEVLP